MVQINTIQPGAPGNSYQTPIIDTSSITRKYLDVNYTPDKPHPMRMLDVYLPDTGDGPYPVIIYMHGGGFIGGQKNAVSVGKFMEALDEGFAFVSVEQRLCIPMPDGSFNPEGVFPWSLFDLKAAIRYLRVNACSYKLDQNRFALVGTSAGGYHVAMAAATQNIPVMYDDSLGFAAVSETVHAVVDLFGVGDMTLQSAFIDEKIKKPSEGSLMIQRQNNADVFLGVSCIDHPNLAYFANPENWVTTDLPPMLIQAGAADGIVPAECSRRLARRIEEVCGKGRAVYDEFTDYKHGDPRFHDPANHRRIFDWLKEKLS